MRSWAAYLVAFVISLLLAVLISPRIPGLVGALITSGTYLLSAVMLMCAILSALREIEQR